MSDPIAPDTARAVAARVDRLEGRDRSPLAIAVTDLQNGTQKVHALLDELTERLRPILRESIEGDGAELLAERERLTPSPLVIDLEGEVRRVMSAQSRVRDLLDRLEV